MDLPGFEDIEIKLSEEDIPIAELIALGLKNKIGKDNAISNRKIRRILSETRKINVGDVKFREMIKYIRRHNLVPCLCSCGKGYYKASNEEEWTEWKESMRRRIRSMEHTLFCAEHFNDGKETL